MQTNIRKCQKVLRSFNNKKSCVVHIRNLGQALNHGLKLQKRLIKNS